MNKNERVKQEQPDDEKEKLKEALVKCALGYTSSEQNDEYSLVDGEMLLTKRKIAVKEVPPQLKAIEMLLCGEKEDYQIWSEEELEKEKIRLIRLLKEIDKNENAEKGKATTKS